MGAIYISVQDFFEDLADIVGMKSGLVLDRTEIVRLLKEHEHFAEFAELKENAGLRIRSEVYEAIVEYLLFRVGRIERPRNAFPGVELFHKYKRDPKKLEMVHAIGDEFTRYLDSTLASSAKVIDPVPFVDAMKAKYGFEGAIMALNYMSSLDVYLTISPWGQPTRHFENEIELKELFTSEKLEPFYGKFIDQRYIDFLHRNFDRVDKINWRKFEGLTGEFFHREGFHVELGSGRNDNNVDVRLWPTKPSDDQPPAVIVQCKRQKATVGKVIVKALYADVLAERANSGLIVTTSELAAGAKTVIKARHYPVEQADRRTVRMWVENMRKPGAGWFL